MTIHQFNFNQGQEKLDQFIPITSDNNNESTKPLGSPVGHDDRDELYYNKEEPQLANNLLDDNIDVNYVEEIRELNIPGFHFIDRAIKNYFSGIRIPVNQGTEKYKMLGVKISGGEASTLIMADKDIRGGRLALPLMSITRTGESHDAKRYSPAYLPTNRKYHNDGRRVELIYRPVPYLLDYSLEIWTEYKSDAEYALYSINSRFNPLASFFLNDTTGFSYELVMKFMSSSDNTELEVDHATHAKVKKLVNIQVEGWLPLPTKIVPTILSNPISVKEGVGAISGNNLTISNENQIRYGGEAYLVNRDQGFKDKK
jgi:hypothetical protein